MVQAFIVHDKKLRIMKVHILFYEQHVIKYAIHGIHHFALPSLPLYE